MTTRVILHTAREYAAALLPHADHEGYRCDSPYERLMGKGCRACGVEAIIAIDDFRRSGDLAAFEEVARPAAAGKKARK